MISDIEVAGSVLLCDVDIGQPASSRSERSEDRFAASGQVLFGQGSELLAHVIYRVVQREFRAAWIGKILWGAVSFPWRVIVVG
jgi:hypothetical protein